MRRAKNVPRVRAPKTARVSGRELPRRSRVARNARLSRPMSMSRETSRTVLKEVASWSLATWAAVIRTCSSLAAGGGYEELMGISASDSRAASRKMSRLSPMRMAKACCIRADMSARGRGGQGRAVEARQLDPELTSAGEARVPISIEGLVHDLQELGRHHAAGGLQARQRVLGHRQYGLGFRVALEQAPLGQRLPQHHAQRPHVRAPIDRDASHLLGRHVCEAPLIVPLRVVCRRSAALAMPKSSTRTLPS